MGISAVGSGYNVEPLNYSITNKSEFSDAYNESVKNSAGSKSVGIVTPVRYPNAQGRSGKASKNDMTSRLENASKEQAFTRLAASYGSATTSYSGSGAGMSYSMVGNTIDLFA